MLVLVPDALRAPLARLLKRAAPRLRVLAHSEIPETHSIRIGSIIGPSLAGWMHTMDFQIKTIFLIAAVPALCAALAGLCLGPLRTTIMVREQPA